MTARVALVTGASQGIGRECAKALAAGGTRVLVGARQQDKLASLVGEIQADGGQAEAVALDVSCADSIDGVFKQYGGEVDILVNNAAITRDGLAMRMSDDAWDAVIQTNLTGSFRCMKAVMRPMTKKRWGRIINISSVVGQAGNVGQSNYVASKAGLIGLTKSLAQELASRNVTVNAVAPGFIATAMTEELDEATNEKILTKIPLGRIGEAKEIASAVCFLASEDAGYITGHVLNVNGGMYM